MKYFRFIATKIMFRFSNLSSSCHYFIHFNSSTLNSLNYFFCSTLNLFMLFGTSMIPNIFFQFIDNFVLWPPRITFPGFTNIFRLIALPFFGSWQFFVLVHARFRKPFFLEIKPFLCPNLAFLASLSVSDYRLTFFWFVALHFLV